MRVINSVLEKGDHSLLKGRAGGRPARHHPLCASPTQYLTMATRLEKYNERKRGKPIIIDYGVVSTFRGTNHPGYNLGFLGSLLITIR